ncbi:hypothetical protein AGMMS49949_03890 [Alphaproteobacteria bacterium]|nr:hypothetical protein AGMMS49949_03890 [Alphaproteobacteria bacterium]GHS96073.1 hypothetical protein AGMMS50296_1840 [Alphaproteobacteria bacterium]
MIKIRTLISTFVVCALIGGGFWVKEKVFKEEFFYSGTLEATRVVIPARVPSQILKFSVKEGDHLKKDDVIALLDDSEFKIQLKEVKSKYERGLALYKNSNSSKNELETLESKKDEAALKISWCTLRSVMDGVVLSKFKEEGEWVAEGTGVLSVANVQEIWTFFYVEQEKIASLALGQTVIGTLPELPGRVFKGKIIKINSEAEFTPKNVQTRKERTRLVFGVKVQFENADETLKPGMSIETFLETPSDTPATQPSSEDAKVPVKAA